MLIAIVISQSAGNIMSSIKDQSLTGFKWSAIGEVSTHGISFVLGLVIARLLMPEDFGVIGMLAIFMAISGQLVNCGFVQDNESKSSYGVMRGLHFQRPHFTQSKLVRCVKGAVLDVVVDIYQ